MANEHDISVKITGEVSSLGSATGQSADLLKGLQSVAQQVSAAVQAASKQAVDVMQQGFVALQGTSQQANATMQRGFSDTGMVLRSMASAMGDAGSAAEKTAESTEKAAEAVNKSAESAKKSSSLWGELGQKLTSIGTALAISITAPMALATHELFDATKTMDSIKLSLNAVTGSADGTRRELVDLREVAKLPGLGLKEAAEGAVRLQSSGMSANMAKDSLMAYGNALATVGKGKPELDLVTLALSQIQAKGKVMGDDLRQLQEQLPQIRVAMKEAFGTADTEALQKMGVSSEEFIAKTTAEFQKLPSIMSGLRNDTENLQDQWFQAMSSMGEGLKPFFSEALKVFTTVGEKIETLGKWFSGLTESQRTWIVSIGIMVAAVGPAIVMAAKLASTFVTIHEALALVRAGMEAKTAAVVASTVAEGAAATAAGGLAAAFRGLTLTMMANPWIALATAIAGVAVALIGLHDTMQSIGSDDKSARTAASRAAQKDVDSYQYAYDHVSDPKQKAEIGRKLGQAKDRLSRQVEADDAVLASTKFDMGADDAKLESSSKVYARTPPMKKKKTAKSDPLESGLRSREAAIEEQRAYNADIDELTSAGASIQVAKVQAAADKEVIAVTKKYDDLRRLAVKHPKEMARIQRDEAAEVLAIEQKAADDIQRLNAKQESDDLRAKEKAAGELGKRLDKTNAEILAAEKKLAADKEVIFKADLAEEKRYFDTINSLAQNLSGRFGSLASSITSMGLKGDLTLKKLADGFKGMAIDIVASIAEMVTKILAEVALLEVANVATGGLVSAVLEAQQGSASIMGYATGGLLSFDVGTPYVPRDMTARIHRREMIVPANMSDAIRSGQMTLGGPAGSGSSSSSSYHDARTYNFSTGMSRQELGRELSRTTAQTSRSGSGMSH